MRRFDIHRYDMLVRVNAFGAAHRDLFPANAFGGRTFTALGTAVRQMNGYLTSEGSGHGAAREGALSKAAARAALRDALESVARTARALALDTPGLEGKFRMPARFNDHDLATAARVFVADATPLAVGFITHGLPKSFLADLRAQLDAFERAAQAHMAARETRAAARAGIESALEDALTIHQRLDAVVPNRLRDNPTVYAAWTTARRMARVRTVAGPVTPVPSPAVPPPPPVTAPAAAAGA